MIALCIVAAVIALIAITKVGILVEWDGDLSLHLTVGPLRFSLSSRKNEGTAGKSQLSDRTAKKKKQKTSSPWKKVLQSNWQELLELVGRVLRMPVLDPFVLKVSFGGDDPAENAIRYGQAWALVGSIMPILEHSFAIGRREIDVNCLADEEGLSVYAKAGLSIRISQCVALAVYALRLFLKLYQQTKQNDKAVQKK